MSELGEDCTTCSEGEGVKGECSGSERVCGHHCNHIWSQDECCWCPAQIDENGDLTDGKPTDSRPAVLDDGTLGLGCGSLWSGADYTAWREDHLPSCAICIGTYGDPQTERFEAGADRG